MEASTLKLIKCLPKVEVGRICGYTGQARWLLIQIDASGRTTWNDGKSSHPCPNDQHESLARLDLQLGLTKYRVHDYRQTQSVNCLLWDRETHKLCFDTRTNAFALVENQWKGNELPE